MAHTPRDLNDASCQFFVTLGRRPELDRQYTAIGQARDAESLRTLQQLAAVPTDRHGRPQSPLRISSMNLVDADRGRVRYLGGVADRTGNTTGSQTAPPASQPDRR